MLFSLGTSTMMGRSPRRENSYDDGKISHDKKNPLDNVRPGGAIGSTYFGDTTG
jgi:hypothetical protein